MWASKKLGRRLKEEMSALEIVTQRKLHVPRVIYSAKACSECGILGPSIWALKRVPVKSVEKLGLEHQGIVFEQPRAFYYRKILIEIHVAAH
jgi:hypothetical protein